MEQEEIDEFARKWVEEIRSKDIVDTEAVSSYFTLLLCYFEGDAQQRERLLDIFPEDVRECFKEVVKKAVKSAHRFIALDKVASTGEFHKTVLSDAYIENEFFL